MADEQQEKTFNLGNTITEKVLESVKNVDVISLIKNVIATAVDDESDEVRDKLTGILNVYTEMSDEDKQQFTNKMKETLASKISYKLKDSDAIKLDGLEEEIGKMLMYRLMLIGAVVLLVIVLLVFFGYKLYKSIKDKELKREEKKKAKQLKKKK